MIASGCGVVEHVKEQSLHNGKEKLSSRMVWKERRQRLG